MFPVVVGGACAVVDRGVTVVDEIGGRVVEDGRGVVVGTGTMVCFPLWFPEHEHVMQPWASITTQAGSHLLKSKEGHPPAPGTDVTDAVVYPDAAVEDAAQ